MALHLRLLVLLMFVTLIVLGFYFAVLHVPEAGGTELTAQLLL